MAQVPVLNEEKISKGGTSFSRAAALGSVMLRETASVLEFGIISIYSETRSNRCKKVYYLTRKSVVIKKKQETPFAVNASYLKMCETDSWNPQY
ncbi:MAG TPA: hypothetical protein VEW46_20265 [Pyrinomonadaceae bacterium]|nr:hypothetical protein [Pyrinomonadaceae bacterium]